MRLIETHEIENWAGSDSAKGRFPHLVKDLICAVIKPDKIRFPSGDAIWLPGYDGVVVCSEKHRLVPFGQSVWELSTEGHYKRKANEDYKKRRKNKVQRGKKRNTTPMVDRQEITFVFVTPRKWPDPDKDAQLAKWKNDGTWHDVKIIDGVDLQAWLEEASSIALQFAAELNLAPPEGLQTPDQAWEDWSYRTKVPASEELVLVGREQQERVLVGQLLGPPSTFTVRGDSPREAWGFALAAIRQMDSAEERQSLYARTIVADNEAVAGRLQYRKNLIIILKQVRGPVSGALSSHGCHVIVPEGNDIHSQENFINLTQPRPARRMFVEALGRMGLPDQEAERTAAYERSSFGGIQGPMRATTSVLLPWIGSSIASQRWDGN